MLSVCAERLENTTEKHLKLLTLKKNKLIEDIGLYFPLWGEQDRSGLLNNFLLEFAVYKKKYESILNQNIENNT